MNFGIHPKNGFLGRWEQSVKKVNTKSFESHAIVYRSGVEFQSESTVTMEVERWRTFKVIKDSTKDDNGPYKGMGRSKYTLKTMFEDCFSEKPRLYGDQTEILKKDLETWAKNNLVIKANSFGIYNATESQLAMRSPDGKKYQVNDLHNLLFDRENIKKPHYVYNVLFESFYKWKPKRLDFNDWATLKTAGIGGCNHGAICLDLADDAEGPTNHHHGANRPCAGLDTCELRKDASKYGSGLCKT